MIRAGLLAGAAAGAAGLLLLPRLVPQSGPASPIGRSDTEAFGPVASGEARSLPERAGGRSVPDLAVREDLPDFLDDPAFDINAQRAAAAAAFSSAVDQFFATAGDMRPEDRARRATALRQTIRTRLDSGALAGVQARRLEEEIVKRLHQKGTPAYDRAVADVAAAYDEADRALAASRTPDPRAERYRQAEARVLREVLAMESFPAGMNRESYLEWRLDAVLADAYGYEIPRAGAQ